jgi:hypothetical protein
MEKGEKYKRKKKSRQNGVHENASNNNRENDRHTISLPSISTIHGTNQIQGASPPGYDELSKCYTRQSIDMESNCFSDSELVDRGSRIYTPTIIDAEPESNGYPLSSSSANKVFTFYTPSNTEETESISKRGANKESPYAVSNILPNVPQSHDEDLPPPAPHGMYANHQFEKLQVFQNQCFGKDDEHGSKPLPPNPFPDLRSHTALYGGASLYAGAGETAMYKKNKKPIPKKRQKKNEDNSSL